VLYSLFVTFRIMGHILYQYHEILEHEGIIVDDEDKAAIENQHKETEMLIVENALRQGQLDKAIELLKDMVKAQPDSIRIREKYQKLLLQYKKKDELFEHTRSYLKELVKQKKNAKALDGFIDIISLYPDFQMKDVDVAAELVKMSQLIKKDKYIIPLTNKLHVYNATNPNILPLYLLLADSLFYIQSNKSAAVEILQFLLIKYPTHPKRMEVKSKLDLFVNQ